MTTDNPQANGQGAPVDAASAKEFTIQKIFIKDVSFEAPNSPAIFTQPSAPKPTPKYLPAYTCISCCAAET